MSVIFVLLLLLFLLQLLQLQLLLLLVLALLLVPVLLLLVYIVSSSPFQVTAVGGDDDGGVTNSSTTTTVAVPHLELLNELHYWLVVIMVFTLLSMFYVVLVLCLHSVYCLRSCMPLFGIWKTHEGVGGPGMQESGQRRFRYVLPICRQRYIKGVQI